MGVSIAFSIASPLLPSIASALGREPEEPKWASSLVQEFIKIQQDQRYRHLRGQEAVDQFYVDAVTMPLELAFITWDLGLAAEFGLYTVFGREPEMPHFRSATAQGFLDAQQEGYKGRTGFEAGELYYRDQWVNRTVDAAVFVGLGFLARQPAARGESVAPQRGSMFNSGLRTTEPASESLRLAVEGKGRTINYALPGSEELRYLDYMRANANVGGPKMTDILLRQNPTKVEVLEEFLHGTQSRLGVIDRLGVQGAEIHVKEFMLRHQRLLGISPEDAKILQQILGR